MPHRERNRDPSRSPTETILWLWVFAVAIGCVVGAIVLYVAYR